MGGDCTLYCIAAPAFVVVTRESLAWVNSPLAINWTNSYRLCALTAVNCMANKEDASTPEDNEIPPELLKISENIVQNARTKKVGYS